MFGRADQGPRAVPLIGASHRKRTAGRYHVRGHYLVTKAHCYGAMATSLETVTCSVSRAKHWRNVNNQDFAVCFYYKNLNLVVKDLQIAQISLNKCATLYNIGHG